LSSACELFDTDPAFGGDQPAPVARPASLALRGYQAKAVGRVFSAFEGGDRSALLVMATGTGKTVTFGTVARAVIDDMGGRVLVLAHRDELIRQAADSLAAIGVEAAVEKAQEYARGALFADPPCVIASVQTLQRKRLQSWPKGHFKLVITDEAHHAAADSYKAIYDHLAPDWHLGVTATPDRLDGENLGQVFQSVAFEYPLFQAITDGHLCRIKVVRCETSVDLSAIKTTGGDLNQGELEEAIRPYIEELAIATRNEIGNRRSIVFTPDVGSGIAFASALASLGISARAIHGDSPDRAEILSGFRSGRHRVLCNCALLTEGFDAPFVSAVVLARPTKSRALYSQMVGRGTRNAPGKADCLAVDFAWLTGRHQLVQPTELLDTTSTSAEVIELAQDMLKKGEESDLLKALERAEKKAKERQVIRIKAVDRPVDYRRVVYDPMAVMDVLGMVNRPESDAVLKVKATPKQVATLEKFGVTGAEHMSKRRATMMLGRVFDRIGKKLATVKQVSHLIANGVDPDEARMLSLQEASERLDVIFGKRKRVS
jgi:superfamily II DNA or RNA helicase